MNPLCYEQQNKFAFQSNDSSKNYCSESIEENKQCDKELHIHAEYEPYLERLSFKEEDLFRTEELSKILHRMNFDFNAELTKVISSKEKICAEQKTVEEKFVYFVKIAFLQIKNNFFYINMKMKVKVKQLFSAIKIFQFLCQINQKKENCE